MSACPASPLPCATPGTSPLRLSPLGLALATLAGGGWVDVRAAGVDAPPSLAPVVVTATRSALPALDTAASVDLVDQNTLQQGQGRVLLAEPLNRVPGIFALNRQNYAQDLLISSRGFGANSAFGARGLRMVVDGIPATMADGQTQIAHIDLASAGRLEALRGPYATLYGNASGGVIQVFTESGQPGMQVSPDLVVGSFGLLKRGLKVSGEQAGINYVADANRLDSDGYRQHSTARRENQNAKLSLQLGEDTRLQLVGNTLSLTAQDPLGLTASQLQNGRTQAGNGSEAYNTRKVVDQAQGGFTLSQRIDAHNRLEIVPYTGVRHTLQYQAGSGASGSPAAANGVIDLRRSYQGIATRWFYANEDLAYPFHGVVGVEANRNDDHRMTFNNLAGVAQLPTASNQNLAQVAKNLDTFMQGDLRLDDNNTVALGLRHSATDLSSVSNNGGSGAGSHAYQATTAMASFQHYLNDNTNVYLAWGSAFDTPTLNQVAYSAASVRNSAVVNTGNFALDAARTTQWELGIKGDLPPADGVTQGGYFRAALFAARTRNDIVIAASNGGKTAYANAPETQRNGLELSTRLTLPAALRLDLAYTLLDARVSQAYNTFVGAATIPTVIGSGSRIPGVPNQNLFADLSWRSRDQHLEGALEFRGVGAMVANDTNSARAPGYGLLGARLVAASDLGAHRLSAFLRVDNLFDRRYVGSVIVNQAAAQYYEPAPGRTWMVGTTATLRF